MQFPFATVKSYLMNAAHFGKKKKISIRYMPKNVNSSNALDNIANATCMLETMKKEGRVMVYDSQ